MRVSLSLVITKSRMEMAGAVVAAKPLRAKPFAGVCAARREAQACASLPGRGLGAWAGGVLTGSWHGPRARHPGRSEAERKFAHRVDVLAPDTGLGRDLTAMLE